MDSQDSLQKQRAKRKRVARIKSFIITAIALWMIISIVVMTLMCIKIASLQKQINILASQSVAASEVVEQENTEEAAVERPKELYSLKDNAENLAEVGDIPKVYLTFDDGPSDNTEQILNILDDYGIKATFFVVGQDIEQYGDAYRRIVNEGHTIGVHSYSHKYADIYESEESFIEDYENISKLVSDVTGVKPKYYRFPGGSSNQVSNTDMSTFINYLNNQQVTYFDWNVTSGDATSQAFTTDELVDNVMNDVVKYKTSVVLLHDASNKVATVDALPELIESLQSIGAMILPISEDTTIIQHMSVVQ
ncbi:MAG: polysaccharide deacetylase [Pseudobutyrivibrio sp.]|nr:polysaccharide deacetylase [Pseudobutyrivibrio sp.]